MHYKPFWDLFNISLALPYLMPSLNLTLFLVPTLSDQSFMPHQNYFCKMQICSITSFLETFNEFRTADRMNCWMAKSLTRGSLHNPHMLSCHFSFHEFSFCTHHTMSPYFYILFSFIFNSLLFYPCQTSKRPSASENSNWSVTYLTIFLGKLSWRRFFWKLEELTKC